MVCTFVDFALSEVCLLFCGGAFEFGADIALPYTGALLCGDILMLRFVMLLGFMLLVGCERTPTNYQALPAVLAVEHFELLNQDGQVVTEATLRGHWSLLFFGYRYCPDVCPTTLAELNRTAKLLGDANVQVVLVSVDPERDSPAELKEYVKYFNPAFTAWTGPAAQLSQLASELHLFYAKQENPGAPYLMDHSSQIVLINPQGEYVGLFTAPHEAHALRDAIVWRMAQDAN